MTEINAYCHFLVDNGYFTTQEILLVFKLMDSTKETLDKMCRVRYNMGLNDIIDWEQMQVNYGFKITTYPLKH